MKDRTWLSRSEGSSLVEFALTLPLLAVLLFGIIQYGFIFNAYMYLRHGMHVAARSASLPGFTNTTKSVVCQAVTPMLDCNRLTVAKPFSNTVSSVTSVTVTGSYGLPLIIRYVVPGAVGNTYTLNAGATYRSN
jgi:Flp pilus assembly protein TadG